MSLWCKKELGDFCCLPVCIIFQCLTFWPRECYFFQSSGFRWQPFLADQSWEWNPFLLPSSSRRVPCTGWSSRWSPCSTRSWTCSAATSWTSVRNWKLKKNCCNCRYNWNYNVFCLPTICVENYFVSALNVVRIFFSSEAGSLFKQIDISKFWDTFFGCNFAHVFFTCLTQINFLQMLLYEMSTSVILETLKTKCFSWYFVSQQKNIWKLLRKAFQKNIKKFN